jgi:hypothetical protein
MDPDPHYCDADSQSWFLSYATKRVSYYALIYLSIYLHIYILNENNKIKSI